MSGQDNFEYYIGFIVPSNRPEKVKRFIKSWKHIPGIRDVSKMILVYQDPVSQEIADQFDASVKIDKFDPSKPMPMLQLRRHGLQLAEDCQFICTLDCDHQFVPRRLEKNYPKSSDEFYMESLSWMLGNPDVGILSQRGYFGGYAWGYTPKKHPKNGLIENNAGGILMRNIGIDKIFPKECWDFVGVLSEPLMGYNIMAEGYALAKRFNCPNKFEAPGKDKHVESGTNLSYSEEVSNQNAQGYIREKFCDPTWRHSDKKYPLLIQQIMKDKFDVSV